MSGGQYAFLVNKQANKTEIAGALKEYFGVDAIAVKTMIIKGKTRRSYKTRKQIKSEDKKKALITLKQGQKIEMFETGGQTEK
jgi:large subunit ribosomal protein L23